MGKPSKSKAPPKTQSDTDEESDTSVIDPDLLRAIKKAINEVVGSKLDELSKVVKDLVQINERITENEKAIQDTSDRLNDLVTKLLPDLTAHYENVAEAMARRQLELEVHRRKWNLVIHGIPGPAKEAPSVTRASCVTFARDVLGVKDADKTSFAACHRLSAKVDAGIIVRFVDLDMRHKWLGGARHLKDRPENRLTFPLRYVL